MNGAADINAALAQRAQLKVQQEAMHEQLSMTKAATAVNYLSLTTHNDKTAEAAENFLQAFFRHATDTLPTKEGEAEFPVLSTA